MLLPEVRGEWVYITSTVPWINEQNGRVVPSLALPDVDWEKPGGRPGQRLPLWRRGSVTSTGDLLLQFKENRELYKLDCPRTKCP
jgi:hypothetical protein